MVQVHNDHMVVRLCTMIRQNIYQRTQRAQFGCVLRADRRVHVSERG